jgi:cbb3-type cytochrome oxidase subunit 3
MSKIFLFALMGFGSFMAIMVLFGSSIAALLWMLKKGLRSLGKLVRAVTDE